MDRRDTLNARLPHALIFRVAACSALLAAGAAAGTPDVVPDDSKLDLFSTMVSVSNKVSDIDEQTGTLEPLSAAVVQSGGTGGTLTHDLDASASFESARSGTVHLSYVRADTKEFGTSVVFSGQALFLYKFAVDQPTQVTIHYDLLATEAPEPPPGPSWWAMQGFTLSIDGQQHFVGYSTLQNPKPPSPISTQGSFTVGVAPGTRNLQIKVLGNATGNQWGVTRTMAGTFRFEIGGPEPWEDLGHALAGSQGEPHLTGTGSLVAGSAMELVLGQALAGAPAFLIVGFSVAAVPFKGGVLVPAPDLVFPGLPTDAAGGLTLATTWPLGVPSGLEFSFQYWLPDAAGPQGFAASNGVRVDTP